ncbi:unnamed protein product [Clonostachys rhizophaga]|uniref:Phosphatidylethanolamine N-methyltransferase n=1 Tax=Clonostachys rhizophaga TaxID=160324 RepID=A0A9N9V4A1_9HYPO|nr:unnamed protein product [Clonostachys rhizophaga]
MASTAKDDLGPDSGSLRQRHHPPASSKQDLESPKQPVDEPHANVNAQNKTYGRTPNGTVFVVADTHDMVSQLLDPRLPKNVSDLLILSIMALHVLVAYYLPSGLKKPVLASIFVFWRLSYNAGIGMLLHVQSHHRRMVTWARKQKIFEPPADGKPNRLYALVKRECELLHVNLEDYDFEKAPIEYNTWLVFRRVVDLILMCDFTSYCLFAIICGHVPHNESLIAGLGRWALGITFIGINLWAKLSAHRTLTYAWHWADFFYLIDQDLTFDGIFELVPHPMYSIGYIGYYGISIMAASYEVLFISIFAHLAQFAFLAAVENPHIDRTYNPPAPRARSKSGSQNELPVGVTQSPGPSSPDQPPANNATLEPPIPVHNMVGLKNIDLFRVTDCVVVIVPMYIAVLTFATPSNSFWQAIFVIHAFFWRVWYHLGLGIILDKQSTSKMFTRHFVKFGESLDEAWRQWKAMHHVSMVMCNTAFVAACWKMYSFPEDWSYGLVLLKHVIGFSLVALQISVAMSIYSSLGEYGWSFGDFFFDQKAKLTYQNGVYRFLNNPDKTLGIAGVWGAALITWSRSIFLLALTTQLLSIYFIAYIERPHMLKIYGDRNMRQEAGITKFIKRSLPDPVKGWQESMDKVIDDTTHFVEEFLDSARPKFTSGVKTIIKDTSALFNTAPARFTITRISADLEGLDPKQYQLTIDGTPSVDSLVSERATGKESITARYPKDVKTKTYEYGTPLHVKWRAPVNHSSKDWIGLYMVTDNRSREITEVPSLGRWSPTNAGEYDLSTADTSIVVAGRRTTSPEGQGSDVVEGEVVFQGDKLWWTQGVFEFRYHHGGKHTVMTISEPFEIRISKFEEEDVSADFKGLYEQAVEHAILPVVVNCLDRNPDIAPTNVEEPFGGHVERDSKYAKRVVYAIREMFGIEFAPAVVPADGNVKKLAWRICNAKQVLAPYSMAASKGTTTPTGEDDMVPLKA